MAFILNSQWIESTTTVKFLGLHIDRELRWKEQMAAALGKVGAMWEDCEAVRGNIRATHASVVPVGGETMDVMWGRHVLTPEASASSCQNDMSSVHVFRMSPKVHLYVIVISN